MFFFMTLPRPTIVIFDMDGTTVRHVNQRLLHVLEFLDDASHRFGRAFLWLKRGRRGPILPPDYAPPSKTHPKIAVHKLMHKLRRKSVDDIVQPFPGIYAVLNFLKNQSVPMAVVSNGLGKGYGEEILDVFKLRPYFKAEVFREHIKKSKPHPEPILLGLHRLETLMARKAHDDDVIWYIGDRHKDITAALAADKQVQARIIPIACAFNASVAILEKGQNPEQIIVSFYDMFERLKEMFDKDVDNPH
jgi:phosphoglycolate phosphatase